MPTDQRILEYLSPEDVLREVDLSSHASELLETVNDRIGSGESVAEMVDYLATETVGLSQCDRVSVAFLEEHGLRVRSHYTNAAYSPVLLDAGYAEDLAGSSLQPIVERGIVRVIHDLEAYGKENPESRSTRILLSEGVRSSMTCPLRVGGRNVGLLFRSARHPQAYERNHVRMHLEVADRLSQSVEKAYRIEQLDRANRAYTEMLSFVTHELKSPVASMMMDADLLSQGMLGELEERQISRLERIKAKGRYLLGLVDEYLALGRIESGQMQLNARQDVDIRVEVVDPAVAVASGQIQARDMELSLDVPSSEVSAECDAALLRIVLVNLLSNAAKYGRQSGRVSLRAGVTGGTLRLAVRNEGQGFTDRERSRLFRKFSRLDNPDLPKATGTGVGLYTVWRIAALHGGRVSAQSEPGQWAEFVVEVPQPLPA